MWNKWVLFLGALLCSFYTSAQCMYQQIPFEDVVNEADLIAEGTIIESETSWDEGLTMIYTIYTFETTAFYKGIPKKRIQVAIPGGTIGLQSISVNPSLHLRIGDKGVLMVNESKLAVGRSVFEVKFGHHAWYPYKAEGMQAVGLFKSYDLKRDALAEAIENITGVKQIRLGASLKPIHATKPVIGSRTITGFSPSTITAGTESVLTINGTGFGSTADTVFFLYASNPSFLAFTLPSQIVSWSPTQIKVKVPDDAGTGPVFVGTSATGGPSQQSATNLTVLSSQTNVLTSTTAYITRHSTIANTGKLTFTLNTNFNSNAAAKAALGRAMRTWRCNSNYNIEVSANTTAINATADDNVNVITFKNLAGPLG
ncbi:MAG: hypothetical protein IPN29_17980 [Saprospiraceae bacterium]|nr:hypothetical protein [Saprospiraceae bacterium]